MGADKDEHVEHGGIARSVVHPLGRRSWHYVNRHVPRAQLAPLISGAFYLTYAQGTVFHYKPEGFDCGRSFPAR